MKNRHFTQIPGGKMSVIAWFRQLDFANWTVTLANVMNVATLLRMISTGFRLPSDWPLTTWAV